MLKSSFVVNKFLCELYNCQLDNKPLVVYLSFGHEDLLSASKKIKAFNLLIINISNHADALAPWDFLDYKGNCDLYLDTYKEIISKALDMLNISNIIIAG